MINTNSKKGFKILLTNFLTNLAKSIFQQTENADFKRLKNFIC